MNLSTVQNNIVRPPLFKEDLDAIANALSDTLHHLQNANIFLTGGTGFFGRWLLESFLYINKQNNLNANLTVLSRNPEDFIATVPYLISDCIHFIRGDVRNFEFAESKYSHVIHAATEASNKLNSEDPLQMFDVIVDGTRRVLDLASRSETKRFLFISSGAIYGPQPPDVSHIQEDQYFGFAPNDPKVAYAEGKRAAEFLCSVYAKQYGIEIPIARCFAFVGPHLPMETHFAIGNFINDFLNQRPIQISGDGSPLRSYLYGSDLTAWLWKILISGQSCRAYNVGSNESISISQLSDIISNNEVKTIHKKSNESISFTSKYIPDNTRVRNELNCEQSKNLAQAINLTIQWYSKCSR